MKYNQQIFTLTYPNHIFLKEWLSVVLETVFQIPRNLVPLGHRERVKETWNPPIHPSKRHQYVASRWICELCEFSASYTLHVKTETNRRLLPSKWSTNPCWIKFIKISPCKIRYSRVVLCMLAAMLNLLDRNLGTILLLSLPVSFSVGTQASQAHRVDGLYLGWKSYRPDNFPHWWIYMKLPWPTTREVDETLPVPVWGVS